MAPAQRGIGRLEAPRDEGGESPGLFLQIIEALKMINPVLDAFSDAEHHGGRRAHAQLVCSPMHADPVFGQALEASDLVTHFVVQNFSSAARNRVEAGIAKTNNRIPQA